MSVKNGEENDPKFRQVTLERPNGKAETRNLFI